jgi:hypothetical protein
MQITIIEERMLYSLHQLTRTVVLIAEIHLIRQPRREEDNYGHSELSARVPGK